MLSLQQHAAIAFPGYPIEFEDQRTILEFASRHCDWGAPLTKDGYDTARSAAFGRFQMRQPTAKSLARTTGNPQLSIHEICWHHRFDPDIEWEWVDTPVTTTVINLMNRVQHLYRKITRVILLIQNPNVAVPLHTDRNDKEYVIAGSCRAIQRDFNRFWGLKWPLTQDANDLGQPVIETADQLWRYHTRNCLYAIREGLCRHGAAPVAHSRGVIFADGILNWDQIDQEHIDPIDLTAIDPDQARRFFAS